MLKFLTKLLGGNKSEKDVAVVKPIVEKVNQYFLELQTLENDDLRGKTNVFKEQIKQHLLPVDEKMQAKQAEIDALPVENIHEKESKYVELDKLKSERDKEIETILTEIQPEAFAVIKETARRFSQNQTLESKATELDKTLAKTKDYIKIVGDNAVYKNTWTAGGGKITWNMVHYDVQLIGGSVLHSGKIAEMSTGEGKTLVSTLPAYLNAIAGEGVHIVTVNDYLSRRDSEWNGPLFEWLGLRVDCIDKYEPGTESRRNAYLADITYGTNNEFGFDYLRDNMVQSPEEMVQRKHHFAMVDEVDSVLIDDARTPLIISGPIGKQDNIEQFFELKPRIEKLVDAQKRAVNQFLTEAKKKIADGKDDPKDGGLALFRAHRGLPKNSALIKFLSEPGIRVKLQKAENYYLADQSKEMPIADEELYFFIDEKNNSVELTDKGIQLITGAGEDPNFFLLPDISQSLISVEKEALTPDEKLLKKESIIQDYTIKAERIHTIQQLLRAYTVYDKDVEYVVMDGKVKIVDEQTGRILEGRRYSEGLHQAIEAKENVKIEATTQTYATITLQNYFRMYHKLAGMTGTAETESAEFWDIYKLDVVSIPTNLPAIRVDNEDLVYKTKREKYGAIIDEIKKLKEQGRPVLVGTTSIEVSELLSRMLRSKHLDHSVLNAKQHAKEAQIISEAGLAGSITIATNMAGRGTDIKLGPGVKEAGGLAIVGTERHESRRVDRQLRGRAGRQGDPGSSQFFVSLEDDLMRMFGSERIAKAMDMTGHQEGDVIQHNMVTKSIERAQKKVEENNFGIRKRLLEYDDVMNKQRNVIYTKRSHALFGERLALDVDNAFYTVAENLTTNYKAINDLDGLKLATIQYLGIETEITEDDLAGKPTQKLSEMLYQEAIERYMAKKQETADFAYEQFQTIVKEKGNNIERVMAPFTDGRRGITVVTNLEKTLATKGFELLNALERQVTLSYIDEAWKDHLRAMDDLKQSVQTASYEQKDPLVIYKVEAFNLFKTMDNGISKNIVEFLSHSSMPVEDERALPIKPYKAPRVSAPVTRATKEKINIKAQPEAEDEEEKEEVVKQEPIRVGPKTGRNEPCPCGSGKKFKNCHGK